VRSVKEQLEDLKRHAGEIRQQFDELRHGHIKIRSLAIDYELPEEVISYRHWINRIYIWVAASVLGLVALGFADMSNMADAFFNKVTQAHHWLIFVIPSAGVLIVRWLTVNFFKGSEGSGIPQVIASLNEEGMEKKLDLLSLRIAIGKTIGTFFGLVSGLSIGREGPTVQIGAIVLKTFSKLLKAPILYSQRSLVLAGGSAGLSAAFNTPMAGIVFAIEELGKSFYESETAVLLMAIIVSGLTALSISGNYVYFGTATATLTGVYKFYAIPVGICGGLAGGLFSLLIIKGTKIIGELPMKKAYLYTLAFGIVISLLGWVTNGATFGTGYDEARALLTSETPDSATLYFPIAKFGATVFSYFTGVPGGIFAPSLSIGAGIGAYLAHIYAHFDYQAMVLLGMVGYFSGVIRSPITSVIIVSEMTNNHQMLFPLLLASIAAYGSARLISKDSLYHALAARYFEVKVEKGVEPAVVLPTGDSSSDKIH